MSCPGRGWSIAPVQPGLSAAVRKNIVFFILPLEVYGPTTFLLRVDSTAYSALPMTLYPSQDFWATLQLGDIGNWLFYGVILSMVTYNLFLYLTVRDSSYLWYVLFIGCFGLLQFSLDGYLYQYLWWPDQGYDHRINFWLTTLALGFAGCFIFKFLDLNRVSPALTITLLTAVGCQLVLALLAFVLDGRLMGRLLTLNGILFMNLALLVGIYAWIKGLVAAKFFVLAWALFYLGNMLFLVNGAGWFELPWSPILSSKLGSFLETMLLSFALAYRIRVLREEGERDRMRAEAQSYYLAQISHEIRTPLNGVLGMTEVLAGTRLDQEQRGYVDTIQGSGSSLLTLINDILDYSKIEAGKMDLYLESVAIRPLVEQQIQLFRAQAEQKGLLLDYHFDPTLPRCMQLDAQRLRQVLSNLISNAIKFTDSGSVTLRVQREDQADQPRLICTVSDTGVGIAAAEFDSLFTAYNQLTATRQRDGKGTGLGLAISHQLVQLMGGELSVTSQPNQGSEFRVTIPLLGGKDEVGLGDNNSKSSLTGLNILVAEDNVVNQKVIQGLLEKLGHRVILATNGDDTVAQRKRPDCCANLILMDCEMPDMDGYRATRLIRDYEREHQQQPMPIVALTAHALEEVRQRCLDAGMDDFLTKPVNTRRLIKVLDRFG